MKSKILDRKKIDSDLSKLRKKKLVFTNGCFDLLHIGHIRYLQEARLLGDALIIGVNSDSSVRKLKGENRPLQNENDRAEILAALECVDFVFIFSEDTPKNWIEKIRPEILVKGGDWAVKDIVGGTFVESYGGQVKSLPFIPGRSTSKIVERILNS